MIGYNHQGGARCSGKWGQGSGPDSPQTPTKTQKFFNPVRNFCMYVCVCLLFLCSVVYITKNVWLHGGTLNRYSEENRLPYKVTQT